MTEKTNPIFEKIRNVKIITYLRELSIVIIGVLITLAITDKVNSNSKRKEIREGLLLVKMELQNNLVLLNDKKTNYEEDIELLTLFRKNIDNIKVIPKEILEQNPNIFGRYLEFNPTKDAYEVLKSSGLMPYIKDKTLLLDLMSCYSQMEKLKNNLSIYTEIKSESIQDFLKIDSNLILELSQKFVDEEDPYPYFEEILKINDIKIFLNRDQIYWNMIFLVKRKLQLKY